MRTIKTIALGGVVCASILLASGCSEEELASLETAYDQPATGADDVQEYDQRAAEVDNAVNNDPPVQQAAGNFTARDGSTCTISVSQEYMLKIVNEARAVARSCGEEFFPAAGTLVWDCQLEQAAWDHTRDMTTHNFFAHKGSDGLHAGSRVTATGYDWQTYGENLAAGFATEDAAVNALLESPGHCKNLMNGRFTEFGSAVMFTENLDYNAYWTQVFAAPL